MPTDAKQSRADGARIVIPAYRAEATVRQAVTAILQYRPEVDFTIVVVDDGHNENLAALLGDLPVQIVATGGTGSAAAARNAGAKDCTSRFLVFVDADVIVEPDCLRRLLAPLLANAAEATVGNYSSEAERLPFASRYKQLYIARIYSRRKGYVRNHFWTAIGAVDTRAFQAVGGFDTTFKGANGEDAELGARLSAAGYRILAVPDALGEHRHPISLWALVRNDWRKGVGAIQHCRQTGAALSDNRHATPRDMLSVLSAVAVALTPAGLFVPTVPLPGTGLFTAILIVLYLSLRSDVLSAFRGQSRWFHVRACGTMWLLDIVRFACLPYGFAVSSPSRSLNPRQGTGALAIRRPSQL
jgi:cellulose synthase/poly-beta-1,6-N-acetylglucosamine synthase-like glycosyltransferase